MPNFTTLLGFRKQKSQWDKTSVGEKRGSVGKGKYSCWVAVGPVRAAWTRIGPEIKEYVENSCKYGPALSLEIYMIGRNEEKAQPKILICSTDVMARKAVKKAIMESGIMENGAMKDYPPIGLGDTSKLPDLLAQEDIISTLPFCSTREDEIPVLSTPGDIAFGRRLFVSRDTLRPATGGSILYVKEKIYQLTAGHAFLEFEGMFPSQISSSSLDDCEFDGMSDSEDDDIDVNIVVEAQSNSASKDTSIEPTGDPTDNITSAIPHNTSSPDLDTSVLVSQPSRDSGVELSAAKISDGDGDRTQTKAPAIPRNLSRAGKLVLHSEGGNKPSLDYALVELEGDYRNSNNEIPWGANGTQRFLRVRPPKKISSKDVAIVTMTASSKFLSGRLSATASYMRLPNQYKFQELYSIRLDGSLHDGDCGSGVLDLAMGHLYGHIVAGCVGTGICYIVPALQVFEDVKDRLKVKGVGLEPFSPFSKIDWKGLESLRIIEFGSKKYLSNLERSVERNEDGKDSSNAKPINTASISFISAVDCQAVEEERQRHLDDSIRDSPFELSTPISRFRSSKLEKKWKANDISHSNKGKRVITKQQTELKTANNYTFEQQFFTLPSDLQVEIIAFLSVPDILSLRLASTNWHNLISLNEVPISRAFLEQNPVPRFALSLYPPPQASNTNLHYICKLWYRLLVASRLSSRIAQWIAQDQLRLKEESKRLEFLHLQARMRRRLIPLIFTIAHFLEIYHQLRLENPMKDRQVLLESWSFNRIEAQVMSRYDNKLLLQVHQVFPLLLEYLRRMFRPPSYLSPLERSIRGYNARSPPTDHVLGAILCIGGLKQVARFLEIDAYEARITAVDEWYSSISHGEIEPPESQSRQWPKMLDGRPSNLASFNSAGQNADNIPSIPINTPHSPNLLDKDIGSTMLTYAGRLFFQTSLAAGPPTGTLVTEYKTLLSSLPPFEQLWVHTANTLLLKRGVIERKQDVKKNAQLRDELFCEDVTDADELSCERAMMNVDQGDQALVHGTVEELVYMGGELLRSVKW